VAVIDVGLAAALVALVLILLGCVVESGRLAFRTGSVLDGLLFVGSILCFAGYGAAAGLFVGSMLWA
jgi:hypothetical protein